ncbi:hypothetical protein CIK05_05060 [Bdellovibrio sp. qaytius]|nr:hypothetical protein CIK05_05060 [Bdellovibrio sp. qaytius]
MKNTLAVLIATIATVSASADRLCMDMKLSSLTKAGLSCPAVTEACVKDYNASETTAKSLILKSSDEGTIRIKFDSYIATRECDAHDTCYGLAFDDKENSANLTYKNIGNSNSGKFDGLRLYTGDKRNSILSEDVCLYDVVQ